MLEPALALRYGQGSGRQPRGSILVGVEAGKVQPQDLVWPIALETLRSRIPACHQTIRIKHVDRVIGDRIDQHLNASLILVRVRPVGSIHILQPLSQ